MSPSDLPTHITHALTPLVGQRLTLARRAADLRGFHFGDLQPIGNGNGGAYVLHIQCPWRIASGDRIHTGSGDLWEPATNLPEDALSDWTYQDGNLQDQRIAELLTGTDPTTGSAMNATAQLLVEQVRGRPCGGAEIELSGGYRLSIFPDGSAIEDWRLLGFRMAEHVVITGGRVAESSDGT